MSQFFTSGGQSIGAAALASVFPIDIQGWFPLRLSSFISLHSKGLSRVVFSKPQFKSINSFALRLLYEVQLSHSYMTTKKNIALTIGTFVSKVMSLFFNMLSRFVIAFLSRSKHLLISWLQSPCDSHPCVVTMCSHPQWFWSPRKLSLSLFPFFL